MEEEVCKEDVDEDGPEQPAFGAEEAGNEGDDHAAVAEEGQRGTNGGSNECA